MRRISFSNHPELINPNLKVKDIKKIIKDQIGISEENLRFRVAFDDLKGEYGDEQPFWHYFIIEVFDISHYETNLVRDIYSKEIYLDLNKKVGELKQIIYD